LSAELGPRGNLGQQAGPDRGDQRIAELAMQAGKQFGEITA
jgi:hypothetical protein